jgi:hypothetical protein
VSSDRSLIEVESIIEDNDPRMFGRRLRILAFSAGLSTAHSSVTYAVCDKTRINVDRIHTDGKKRRSGFSLVRGAA